MLSKTENQLLRDDVQAETPTAQIVEIEPNSLQAVVEEITENNQCRYPLLALRLLIHAMTKIDTQGRVYISARQLSKSLDVHYDTVTKCLKYLREIEVLRIER